MRYLKTSMFIVVVGTVAAIENFTTNGNNNLVEMPFSRNSLNASESSAAPNMGPEVAEIDTEETMVKNLTIAARPNPNKSGLLRCQDPVTKLFIPNAYACKNERDSKICETLFSPPDKTTGRRDPRCDLPGMEDISNTCRRQCAVCCEHIDYSCEDDDSGLIDCAKNLDKCSSSRWLDPLSKYCAGSCGLCQRTSCRDNVAVCVSRKTDCTNPNHKEVMRKQCARTCGFCQVGGIRTSEVPDNTNVANGISMSKQCVDLALNCATRSNLCENILYSEYMGRYCANTCNKCDSQPTLATARPTTCMDVNVDCDKWVRGGLCTNKLYSVDYKRTHCAYSCKLC